MYQHYVNYYNTFLQRLIEHTDPEHPDYHLLQVGNLIYCKLGQVRLRLGRVILVFSFIIFTSSIVVLYRINLFMYSIHLVPI
jgi:hypothetical protein